MDTTATITVTVTDDTIHHVIDDPGFDWYWAESALWTPTGLTVTYWTDGERRYCPEDTLRTTDGRTARRHTTTASLRRLARALAEIASGRVTGDGYQVAAARDFLTRPGEADGDALTADLVVQQAIFRTIAFG